MDTPRLLCPHLVVVANDAVNLGLQFFDARRAGLFAQPLLQRLVVAIHFALGLGRRFQAILELLAENPGPQLQHASLVVRAGGGLGRATTDSPAKFTRGDPSFSSFA
jgi:hypothetical protein